MAITEALVITDEQYDSPLQKRTIKAELQGVQFSDRFKEHIDTIEEEEKKTISAKDESAAALELFKIIKMLHSGVIDHSLLEEVEPIDGVSQGEKRAVVETLKEVIEQVLRGGSADDDESLFKLFHSLPLDLQELLLSAFPQLEEMLEFEEKQMAEESENPDSETTLISNLYDLKKLEEL